jgi:hypothetical protein
MSENNAQRPAQTRRVEAEETRKSLDWFEVAPPVPVQAPAAQAEPTPSEPAAPPQDTAPTDFDG